ncbi:hypothetical protein HGM15179_005797 [Zosterops borbonicus]|uniref:C-type lectin domain-containing protein n=1 Tax=Zosterops borbonicus TaxID=364589 RepID=A0A8K1LPL1_9PASS|nr:hypothetical protein HGM15179_005797 [Zosterops borbonicus]
MWPCLLLALALLGTVPASHPAPLQLQGIPAGETPQWRYAFVNKLRTYALAQGYCQDKYRGQLASVHSSARNQELQKLARTYNTFISPWIGAVTSCKAGKWKSYWEDSSAWNYANWAPTQPLHIVTTCTTLSVRGKWKSYWEDSSAWNYANWAPTQPLHIVTTCTTLSVRDGLWRSRICLQLRPFICQY